MAASKKKNYALQKKKEQTVAFTPSNGSMTSEICKLAMLTTVLLYRCKATRICITTHKNDKFSELHMVEYKADIRNAK